MATKIFLILLLLTIIQLPLMVGYKLDEATRERMKQREEQLSQEMTRLLQELERRIQEQSSQEKCDFAWGALPFSALQQWQFWAIAGLVVLLFGLCWRLRKRSHQRASSSKEGSSRNQLDEEHEERPSHARDVGRISAKRYIHLSESCTMVEDLVDELVCMCQKLSRNSFMPRLKPVIGVGSTLGGWRAHEDDAVFRLLVPLKPPHGHTFHLELGTAGQMPAKYSCLRVELECTCTSERLSKSMLCFLHTAEEDLKRNQGPSLLGTLCTGPYLDVEKTTRWFQNLVKYAWVVLPRLRHCHLTVLPSRRSCKLRVMDTSNSTILIQVMFGVQHGDSYTLLSTQ